MWRTLRKSPGNHRIVSVAKPLLVRLEDIKRRNVGLNTLITRTYGDAKYCSNLFDKYLASREHRDAKYLSKRLLQYFIFSDITV